MCNQTRREFLKITGFTVASAGAFPLLPRCASTGQITGTKSKRPNILYIMSDDHSTSTVSCYGSWLSKVAKTPNIDRFAEEGMRFNNCFVTNSICTPARAVVLTGQHSHINGVYTLGDSMAPERQNVAKLLQQAGYQTAVVGKWHLKTDPSGFDYWNVLPGQGRYHNPIMRAKSDPKKTVEHQGFSSDVIAGMAINWMKNRDKNKPFFMMCHFKAPHRPWDPADKYKTLYEDVTFPEPPTLLDNYKNRSRAAANATLKIGENMGRKDLKQDKPENIDRDTLRKWAYQIYVKDYLRCIASVDKNVGRLLDRLDEAGLTENTVVFYTSDQGMFVGEHGYYDKRFMYEPSLRAPLLVRYPVQIEPGTVSDKMVLNLDFPETFLDYAGVKIPADMQGRSLRPILAGKTPSDWRKSMYYRYWMHLAHHGVPAHYGVRTERYKLIFYYGLPLDKAGAVKKPTEPEWELFDLKKDPQEINNVYGDHAYADVVKKLKAELLRLKKQLGDEDDKYPAMKEVVEKHWGGQNAKGRVWGRSAGSVEPKRRPPGRTGQWLLGGGNRP